MRRDEIRHALPPPILIGGDAAKSPESMRMHQVRLKFKQRLPVLGGIAELMRPPGPERFHEHRRPLADICSRMFILGAKHVDVHILRL